MREVIETPFEYMVYDGRQCSDGTDYLIKVRSEQRFEIGQVVVYRSRGCCFAAKVISELDPSDPRSYAEENVRVPIARPFRDYHELWTLGCTMTDVNNITIPKKLPTVTYKFKAHFEGEEKPKIIPSQYSYRTMEEAIFSAQDDMNYYVNRKGAKFCDDLTFEEK